MAARLPQIDPKATIAPISLPNVTVAKDDPVSAVQSQFYSNLTSRLDALGTSVNRMALKQGEAAGLARGAAAASAADLLETAKQTGKPITAADLPGDPSSISVIEQAAYKGGLAVVTSQFAVDGRRAIQAAALKASQDPNMTPGAFNMILNNIVKERTEALGNISPVEAAKLNATLSIAALSTGTTLARSFFTQQKSLRKAAAIASVSVFQNDIMADIAGYQKTPGEPSLEKTIDAQLDQLESHLTNEGVPANTVAIQLKAVRAAIVEQKISVIHEWAETGDYTDDPLLAYRKLAGGKAESRIQDIYKSLSSSGRNTAQQRIFSLYTRQQTIKRDEEADDKLAIEKASETMSSDLNDLRSTGQLGEFRVLRDELNRIDPTAAKAFFNATEFGLTPFNDRPFITLLENDIDDFDYDRRVQSGEEKRLIERLVDGRNDGLIIPETYKALRKKIIDRNEEDLNAALREAQIEFNYEPRNILSIDPTGPQMEARQNYKRAEQRIREAFRRDPEQDLLKATRDILKDLKKPEKNIDDLVGKLPPSLDTPEKVDAAVKALKGGDKSRAALLLQHRPTIEQLKAMGWK
jgi:hypothetical protein